MRYAKERAPYKTDFECYENASITGYHATYVEDVGFGSRK